MKLNYLLLIMFLINTTLSAQGFLYKDGETGYGGNINYLANNEGRGYGGNFSYTINSMISIGASFGYGKIKNPETSSIAFGPYLNFYPVKYSKSDPITILFGAGINYYVHNNDILDSLELNMIGASIDVITAVLYHIRIDQSWQVIPGISFGYHYRSLRISDKSYASMEEKGNFTSVELSTDIAFRIYDKSLLYFGPAIDFGLSGKNNKRTIYGFGIGVAFK
jgi:hypothetical protein